MILIALEYARLALSDVALAHGLQAIVVELCVRACVRGRGRGRGRGGVAA